MADVQDTLDLNGAAVTSALTPGQPASDAILHVLAHMAHSDGVVHPSELEFLTMLLPGRSEASLLEWIQDVGAESPALDRIAAALTADDDRWTCLRFSARMAWKDGELQAEEREFLQSLADSMGLPSFAVDRVQRAMEPGRTRFTTGQIIEAVQKVKWDAVQVASGPLASADLAAVSPPGAELVCRVGLDRVEVLAVFREGIAARFLEGACFLSWSEIITTRADFGLGASVSLLTEGGASYRLVDARLRGIAAIIDLLLTGTDQPPGVTADVKQVLGG